MQQRRLRLGDVLDDYCPRERRITNHVVVAIVEDNVKQTRCSTCDADHEYKQAKVPSARRRKTAAPAAHLVDANRPQSEVHNEPDDAQAIEDVPVMADSVDAEDHGGDQAEEHAELAAAAAQAPEPVEAEIVEEGDPKDEWPVHRPLIRATLPRPEGHVPERKAPDFTFRPGGGKFDANRNGQRPRGGHRPARQAFGQSPSSGQGSRFGGQRGPGQGQGGGPPGQRQGNRSGQGGAGRPGPGQGQNRGPRPGGGRKRGR